MNENNKSSMSKKAAIAGIAISSIAASDDWKAQAFICGVAIVAIMVQGFLDWKKTATKSADRSVCRG